MDLTENEPPTETCIICLEDVPQPKLHVVGDCLHRFCATCLQSHIHSNLEERQYPIACPHPGCTTTVTPEECNMILRSGEDRQLLAQVSTAVINLRLLHADALRMHPWHTC